MNPKIQDTEVEGFCDICIKYIVISHTLHITPFLFFSKTLYIVQYCEKYIWYTNYIFCLANLHKKIYGSHLNQIIWLIQVDAFFGICIKYIGISNISHLTP